MSDLGDTVDYQDSNDDFMNEDAKFLEQEAEESILKEEDHESENEADKVYNFFYECYLHLCILYFKGIGGLNHLFHNLIFNKIYKK